MLNDTIVAQATPHGAGALAIVRLSGPDAVAIAGRVFQPSGKLRDLASHACATGSIVDGEQVVDQVVAAVFRAPRSYTGEDIVEITCHGSPVVVERLLALLLGAGARSAREGEFTQRAFLNGKMDLAQAEGVAALIAARSSAGADAALRVLRGSLSQALTACMTALTDARVLIETSLDLQEDGAADVLAALPATNEAEIDGLLRVEEERLARLLEGSRAGRLLEEGARVALIGRPNAGKSSLFNALLARERAIVSPEPGTTRDALEAWVEWNGMAIALLDTAGLGTPQVDVERESMRRAREAAAGATLAVLVVDTCAEQRSELEVLVQSTGAAPGRLLLALHKWDLGPAEPWQALAERGVLALSDPGAAGEAATRLVRVVRTSAVGEPGAGALREAASAQLADGIAHPAEVLAVGQRQRDLLKQAHAAVARARELLRAAEGGELVAFELREALEALAEILGRRADPMLLEAIFSRFCVGK